MPNRDAPELDLVVDRASPVPLYLQVARQIEDAIITGRLGPGDRIPNELELTDRLGLSRPTMRQAIAHLVDKGLLVRKRGVGTQVVMSQVRRPLELSSLNDDLAAAGARPATQVLGLAQVPCSDAVADALGLTPGRPVIRIERLRLAFAEPLALMTNYLPIGLVALDTDRLTRHGLYELLRSAGLHLRVAGQTIGAAVADPAQAELLHERPGAALLTMTRTTFDDTGRAIERASHVYRASRYSFELTLVEK
jgi:DNA-binding GntR family transcriptional regulator